MCSTVEYKMWSTMDKVDRSYPLLTAASDKISHGNKTSRKQPLVKDKSPRSEISYLAQHRKYRENRENQIALNKQAARLKVKSSSDVTTTAGPDSRLKKLAKIDRKLKKTRKDGNKFVPGKLQREKTFCVFTASTGPAEFERPTNMPRRPIQDDEPEFLDRGYVSDRPCSFGDKRAAGEQRSARPKSAGQALYAVDSDDDSSLGGEIEILDIDDDGEAFIVAGNDCWDAKPSRQAADTQPPTSRHHGIPDEASRYNGSQHNVREQTDHSNVRDSSRHSPVDFINHPPQMLAPVTHERRRVKSDSSMVPQRKSASEKWRSGDIVHRESETTWQRKNSYPAHSKYGGALKDGGIYTENKYAKAMEKVLNKYTHLTLGEKGGAPRGSHMGPKSHGYGPRNSLPRKLKPLLNRDKLGQVSEKS